MKRLVLTIISAAVGLFAAAQDLIVTTDARRIDAHIVDVSAKGLQYRLAGDVNDSVFCLPVSEVVSILFENGQVAVYNNALRDSTLYAHTYQEPILPGVIAKRDKSYFLSQGNGKMTKMSELAYLRFIEDNCPKAWKSYQKADRMWNIGWRFFGSGLGLVAVGLPVYFVGWKLENASAQENRTYGQGMSLAGIIMMAGGGAATIVSIPLLAVSDQRRKNTHKVYNECYFEQHAPVARSDSEAGGNAFSLHLQATTDGLGLSFHF